jgi:hypothetical protein
MAASDGATLVARGLSAAYGDRQLFSGVDLVVGPGDVIGLVGANGAGKSTLLRLLVSLAGGGPASLSLEPSGPEPASSGPAAPPAAAPPAAVLPGAAVPGPGPGSGTGRAAIPPGAEWSAVIPFSSKCGGGAAQPAASTAAARAAAPAAARQSRGCARRRCLITSMPRC